VCACVRVVVCTRTRRTSATKYSTGSMHVCVGACVRVCACVCGYVCTHKKRSPGGDVTLKRVCEKSLENQESV